MPQYKRCCIPGGTYFFTVTLANRKSQLLVDHFDLLSSTIRTVNKTRPFLLRGWVVLPEHLHCIWTLPDGDDDFSGRWWAIKSHFTRRYRESCRQTALQAYADLRCESEMPGIPIWQNRFWEHAVRDRKDFNTHLNYIHINPLKHGYVDQVKFWPYSSFHYFVRKGIYPENWGGKVNEYSESDFGE